MRFSPGDTLDVTALPLGSLCTLNYQKGAERSGGMKGEVRDEYCPASHGSHDYEVNHISRPSKTPVNDSQPSLRHPVAADFDRCFPLKSR
jgi:hypothetical protein